MLLENKVTNKPTQPKTISLLHRPSSRGEAVKLYLKFSTKKLWIYSQSAYETLSYEAHASSADFRFFFECRNVRLCQVLARYRGHLRAVRISRRRQSF